MGRRCHDQRLAKGLDAAAGHQLQRAVAGALEASKKAKLPRSFWAWDEIVEINKTGYWPYTPNTNLLYGLSEALDMLKPKGLDKCSRATSAGPKQCARRVNAWGLPIQCADPKVYSPVLTGVITPAGIDADALRKLIHERFDMSLGTGLEN